VYSAVKLSVVAPFFIRLLPTDLPSINHSTTLPFNAFPLLSFKTAFAETGSPNAADAELSEISDAFKLPNHWLLPF
jgi:hypothetical protein